MCLVMGLLIAPWYLYKAFDFQAGCDRNNTALLVTDFHEGRDLLQRLVHAGSMVVAAITPLGAVLLLIAVLAGLWDPLQRWLVGVFVVPLGLIWAMAFSYDLRNLAVIVPWVGAAAGNGLMQIAAWAGEFYGSRARSVPTRSGHHACMVDEAATWHTRWRPRLRFWFVSAVAASEKQESNTEKRPLPGFLRIGHLVGLFTLLVIAVCLCVNDQTLLARQRRQQRMVGVPELNRELYGYAADHPGEAMIGTDYQAMRWLPELGRRSVVCTCHDSSAFRQTFDRPEVRYVLVRTDGAAAEVRAFLDGQAATRFVFENHGFAFYEKRIGERASVAAVP
jgi:hypothetical protein